MRLYQICVEIYEPTNDFPIVVHVFQGKTKREAKAIHDAHRKADRFLRECEDSGCYAGKVPCQAYVSEGWANG